MESCTDVYIHHGYISHERISSDENKRKKGCVICSLLLACVHTNTQANTHSLSHTHCWTAISLRITCMIHSIQVTIYPSARVLYSGVTRFLSLPPHITQCYDTVTNRPLVLWRRVQLTTSQSRFEGTGEFLAGELPANLSFWISFSKGEGGGEDVTTCANKKSLKHMQSNFLRASARTLCKFYDLRVPIISYQI
jgi:hypothetical protein